MRFTIRNAKKNDMPQVLSLIKELAVFEKEPEAVEVTIRDLENDGFSENPSFHCFVAEVNGKIEGLALVYNRYSTWKGKALHLEDLIVSNAMRGSGIGSALLDEVVKYGHHLGVKRITWEVLNWNTPAISFYEKTGAHVSDQWQTVSMSEKNLKKYLES